MSKSLSYLVTSQDVETVQQSQVLKHLGICKENEAGCGAEAQLHSFHQSIYRIHINKLF